VGEHSSSATEIGMAFVKACQPPTKSEVMEKV